MTFAPAPSAFLPPTNTLIAYLTGLLEQCIEYDLAGRVNPYRLDCRRTRILWFLEYASTTLLARLFYVVNYSP